MQASKANPALVRSEPILDNLEKVSYLYCRALRLCEFYPEVEKQRVLAVIDAEYADFNRACELARKGKSLDSLEKSIGKSLRLWKSGKLPVQIALYGNRKVSQSDINKREKLSRKLTGKCKQTYQRALETLQDIEEFQKTDLSSLKQNLSEEFNRYEHSFLMFKAGLSFDRIREFTQLDIKGFVVNKTIPNLISLYGGLSLSKDEKLARVRKCSELKERVEIAIAKVKQKEGSAEGRGKTAAVLRSELEQIDFFMRLHFRGLSPNSIKSISAVNGSRWLNGSLTRNLTRKSRDFEKHDYKMPTQFSPELSFILGAYYASTRLFSIERMIEVSSKDRKHLERFRQSFKKVFGIDTNEIIYKAGLYYTTIARKSLMRDLFDFIGVENSANPVVPYEILKRPADCRRFLEGYFAFSSSTITEKLLLYQLKRKNSTNLLKAVAVGLYLEGIYPGFLLKEDVAWLKIRAVEDLNKFTGLFSNVVSVSEEARQALAESPLSRRFLGSYQEYEKVVKVMNEELSSSDNIDVEKILTSAGIPYDPHQINGAVRLRLWQWRRGIKPEMVSRVEMLKSLLADLYPESVL